MPKSAWHEPNSEHVGPAEQIPHQNPIRETNMNAVMKRPPEEVPEIALKAYPKVEAENYFHSHA